MSLRDNRYLTPIASIIVVVLCSTTANAHDPYEITSVAYVRSNQIELFIEMEFPAGMTLAGNKPVRDIAVVSQFESALPRLRELAGEFFPAHSGQQCGGCSLNKC